MESDFGSQVWKVNFDQIEPGGNKARNVHEFMSLVFLSLFALSGENFLYCSMKYECNVFCPLIKQTTLSLKVPLFLFYSLIQVCNPVIITDLTFL